MLTQHDVEHQVDARLPKRLAAMDIRDLIKPLSSPPTKREIHSPLLHSNQTTKSKLSFTSSISLPPMQASYSILPSPSDPSNFSRGGGQGASSQPNYYVHPGQQPMLSYQQTQPSISQHGQAQPQQPGGWSNGYNPNKRPSPTDDNRSGPPPKRQSKWNPEEDRKIIAYRGQGMKWSEISARLYPRTEIGCRLHYQNYLEKRSDWDDEKKNKLARVYERVKEDMWKIVANEMKIPWRSAEGMHWILGETDMARRANVTPFSNTIQSFSNISGPPAPAIYTNGHAPSNIHTDRRPSFHRKGSTTIVFDADQVVALNAPGVTATTGPVSTFTGVMAGHRDSIGSSSVETAPRGAEGYHQPCSTHQQPPPPSHHHANADDPITLSPRTYQAMREKGVLLPSVSQLECMVPVVNNHNGSTSSSVAGDRSSRKASVSSHSSGEVEGGGVASNEGGRRSSKRSV